jgi:hypothetical protein
MPLQEDAVYVAPDGRRFQAQLDKRQYGMHRSWTLIPLPGSDSTKSSLSRDVLERMLFLDRGKIVRFDFKSPAVVIDTGWKAADLRREIARPK